MIDPGAAENQLVVGHLEPPGQHLAGTLHAMAQPDVRPPGGTIKGPAVRRHRVDVVEQQRVRSEPIQLVPELDQHGNGAQRPEDAARAKRVADTLLDAVTLRDFDVIGVGFQAALLKGGDDVVGTAYRLAPVGGRLDPRREPAAVDQRLDQVARLRQPSRVDIHQGERAGLKRRRQQNIAAQVAREHHAAGSDKGDFRHRPWVSFRRFQARSRRRHLRRARVRPPRDAAGAAPPSARPAAPA